MFHISMLTIQRGTDVELFKLSTITILISSRIQQIQLDICSSILSCLGETIKAFLFFTHWVPSHVSTTCSAKGIEACILTPPCQLLRLEIFVVRMGSFFTELKVVLPQILFQSSNAHAAIYNTVHYTAQQYNTLYNTIQYNTIQYNTMHCKLT